MKKLFSLFKAYYKPSDSVASSSLLPELPAFGLYIRENNSVEDALRSDWQRVGRSLRYGLDNVDVKKT